MFCLRAPNEEDELRKVNKKIDKELELERRLRKKEVKILLLGPGESGKSTVFKQIKIIYLDGFTKDELITTRQAIYSNISQCTRNICQAMKKLSIPFASKEAEVEAQELLDIPLTARLEGPLITQLLKSTALLLEDSGIQACIERSREYYLPDSAPYFFENLKRYGDLEFVPTEQDALRVRMKTTGISELHFLMGHIPIHMVDVGGQRSERKKWIHCFENVTSLIFFVALSSYTQQMAEDHTQNRMLETLVLFGQVITSEWFQRTSIILFLNFTDLFRERLKKFPLNKYFPQYTGGSDFEKAATFIYQRFQELNKNGLRIYPHLTCATDTDNIKFVFKAIKETVIQNNLKHAGLM